MGKLAQRVGPINDADRLRTLLDDCETMVASLNKLNVRDLVAAMDSAHSSIDALTLSGSDVRGEVSRLQSIDDRVKRRADEVVKLLGGRDSYASLKAASATSAELVVWQLDRELDIRRREFLKRIGLWLAISVVLVIAIYIASPVLFPPDPVGDAVAIASRSLDKNDIPTALAAIDSTLLKMPTNTDLLIWKGILLEMSGDFSGSQTSYAQGLANANSDIDYYLERAITFVRIGESLKVITDTNTVLLKYPDSAEAYYIRATGYEGIGKRSEAMDDLQKSADLAQAAGNDALFAQSRVRLGTLMQAGR